MFFKLKVLKCSRSCRDFKQNRKKKKITLTCKRGQEHKTMQYFLKKKCGVSCEIPLCQ